MIDPVAIDSSLFWKISENEEISGGLSMSEAWRSFTMSSLSAVTFLFWMKGMMERAPSWAILRIVPQGRWWVSSNAARHPPARPTDTHTHTHTPTCTHPQ